MSAVVDMLTDAAWSFVALLIGFTWALTNRRM